MTLNSEVVRIAYSLMAEDDVVEIYTNAPRALDYRGSRQIGQLGLLRIVSVSGSQKMAAVQKLRYVDRGFFATSHRPDAVAFVAQQETMERPSGAKDRSEQDGFVGSDGV